MNSGHENTAPAQKDWCHLQHPTGLRGHSQVLRETSGINNNPLSNQVVSYDCEATCRTAREFSRGREAVSTAGPSRTDLPAEWDCVFIRTLPDLVPYTVRPIISSACAKSSFPIEMSSTWYFLCSLFMLFWNSGFEGHLFRAVKCYRGWCPEPCASKGKLAGL